jgi:glycosyltransferase involved in cell wall biosynthesis
METTELEKTQTVSEEQKSNNQLIDEVIAKIATKNYKVYFYCPPLNIPSGGIFVLLNYAKTLTDAGYDVKVIYEPREDRKASYEASQKARKAISIYEKFIPSWAGDVINGLKIMPLGNEDIKFTDNSTEKTEVLNLGPEDFLFIPEGFPNIMEQTAQIPCKKIILCQSWYYILNGLRVGQTWQQYGIQDVISVSDGITEYLNAVMPGLKIKELKQGVDRDLFKFVNQVDKKPVIAYQPGRSQDAVLKTHNIIKTFYAFFPHYRWIRFVELQNLSKKEYAERVGESAFVLYADEIAGFGTLPLEAMASGTHVVGWTPLGSKEYIKDNNGYWCTNGDIFRLAEMIGLALDSYFSGTLDEINIQNVYEEVLKNYTKENEKETILNLQKQYENERIEEFTKFKQ